MLAVEVPDPWRGGGNLGIGRGIGEGGCCVP